MSQPLDLSRWPDLPPEVVAAFAAAQFELSVERAARRHEQAVVAEKDAFITEIEALVATLEGQIQQYRRAKFGPKSEKLDPAQLDLALEGETLFAIGSRTMVERDRHRRDPITENRGRASPRSRRRSPPARAFRRSGPRADRARPERCPRACRRWSG